MLAVLQRYRIVNPDPQIADGFAALLEKYPYLHDHLADALIAATAWKKNLEVVTPATLRLLRKSTSGAFQKTEK